MSFDDDSYWKSLLGELGTDVTEIKTRYEPELPPNVMVTNNYDDINLADYFQFDSRDSQPELPSPYDEGMDNVDAVDYTRGIAFESRIEEVPLQSQNESTEEIHMVRNVTPAYPPPPPPVPLDFLMNVSRLKQREGGAFQTSNVKAFAGPSEVFQDVDLQVSGQIYKDFIFQTDEREIEGSTIKQDNTDSTAAKTTEKSKIQAVTPVQIQKEPPNEALAKGIYNVTTTGISYIAMGLQSRHLNTALTVAVDTISLVRTQAVTQLSKYLAGNLYMASFVGCVSESTFFVLDRAKLMSTQFGGRVTFDDPQQQYLNKIRSSNNWQHLLLRYSMATLTWKQRQLLDETRDGGVFENIDIQAFTEQQVNSQNFNKTASRKDVKLMRIANEYFYLTAGALEEAQAASSTSSAVEVLSEAPYKPSGSTAGTSAAAGAKGTPDKNGAASSSSASSFSGVAFDEKAGHNALVKRYNSSSAGAAGGSSNSRGYDSDQEPIDNVSVHGAADGRGGLACKSSDTDLASEPSAVALKFVQSNIHAWLMREAENGDDDAQYALARFFTPPAFQEKTSCAICSRSFGVTLFRHHCRFCGRSVCEDHSKDRRAIYRFGIVQPVRVCKKCCFNLDEIQRRDNLIWKESRVQAYLQRKLIPYFNPLVDRGIDKAMRIADYSIIVAKSTLVLNFPTKIVLETVDIMKRYGLSGFAGLMLRQDFLESVETLKKISGMDDMFQMSLHELTACIYYKLAIDRGLRGCNPDGELIAHQPVEPLHPTSATNKQGAPPEHNKPQSQVLEGDVIEADEVNYSCKVASDRDIDEAIRFASLALKIVYEPNPVDCQRLAKTQGWDLIFTNGESNLAPEQPCYCLFGCDLDALDKQPQTTNVKKRKEAVLAIRGTQTIQDVVTDIRAAPVEFPPPKEEILNAMNGGTVIDEETPEEGGAAGGSRNSNEDEGISQAWEWLHAAQNSNTYACGGVVRSAMYVLREVGPALMRLKEQGYSIVITGHSLGAAVAALVTYLLKYNGVPRVKGMLYSCPNCVDAVTAEKLRDCTLNVVVHDDVISRITPQSIRILMKELLVFREQIFKHLQQDWKDVISRATTIWQPRWRTDARYLTAAGGDTQKLLTAPVVPKITTTASSTNTAANGSSGNGGNGKEVRSDDGSMIMVEDEELAALWLPGRIIHIFFNRGQYRAAEVSRNFPDLRKIEVQGNIFDDHRSKNIFDALLEVRSVRHARVRPPEWMPFTASNVCMCCQSDFTWHSTFRGEAQEYRERYCCRHCGQLVCGPCSPHRRPIPKYGLVFPERICDTCFNKGDFAML